MDYSSFGLDADDGYPVPPNAWTDVKLREEYADPGDDHIPGLNPSILRGDPSIYALEAGLTLSGAYGTSVQVRTVETRHSAGPPAVDEIVEVGDPSTTYPTVEEHVHHSAIGSVQEGRKLRIQVRHTTPEDTPVILTRARVRVLFQK